jgi:complex I intermediate-associated protein 30 (CIA30)
MSPVRPLLTVFALALASCTSEPRILPLVGGTIDTFEDGDHFNAAQRPWESIAEGAGTRASLDVAPGGFFRVSIHHLELSGVRPAGTGGSGVVGVRSSISELPPAADPSRSAMARDVTAYSGLTLALKGTPGSYIVQIGTSSVTDFDYYNAYVEVGEEWNEFRLPFSAFHQEGFGRAIPWTGRDVTHIAVFANLEGYFTFGLDDVRFHKEN